jgi:oxalate decarboxylase
VRQSGSVIPLGVYLAVKRGDQRILVQPCDVPFAMGHYIENIGTTPVRFLEVFKSSYYADVSLNQWLALTPPELVEAHMKLDAKVMAALHKEKFPVVPG